MRKIFGLLIFALVMIGTVYEEQAVAQSQRTIFSNKLYAASQIDTSNGVGTPQGYYQIGTYLRVNLLTTFVAITAKDSVNIKIYLDTRPYGFSKWTVQDSVSLSVQTDSVQVSSWLIRGSAVDRGAIGVTDYVRFRNSFASTLNGSGTARYTQQLQLR
jgi:hypothetical protein